MSDKTVMEEFVSSPDGQYNKSIFFASYCDLTIFVEDTNRGNIYEVLFSRLLEDKISFEKINLSGGKDKVKEFYFEHKKDPSVPRFFLVDLDFDDLHGHEKINDINFTYLEKYSIENYFIDNEVAGHFLNSRLQVGFDKCIDILNIDKWIKNLQDEYKETLILFLVIQSLKINQSNTSLPGEYFLEKSSSKIDKEKISRYYDEVLSDAISVGKEKEFYTQFEYYYKRLEMYSPNYWNIIPGKQLLSFFSKYIVNYCTRKSVEMDDFYHLCSFHLDIENLKFVRDNINNYLLSYKSHVS